MTEPYTLESMYPAREVVQEDGTVQEWRQILPHQAKVHEKTTPSGKTPEKDKTFYILHSGGVGSGKSIGMCVELLNIVRKYPGITIWSVAPYDYYFDEFVWPTLREVLPDDSPLIEKINIKERVYYFRNGSRWTFKAFDDPNKVKGFSCNIVHFVEMSELAVCKYPAVSRVGCPVTGPHPESNHRYHSQDTHRLETHLPRIYRSALRSSHPA